MESKGKSEFNFHKIREDEAKYVSEALADDWIRRMARGPSALAPSVEEIEQEIKTTPGAWFVMQDGTAKVKVGWFRITPVDRWEADLGMVITDPAYRYQQYGYYWTRDILLPLAFPVFHRASWHTYEYNTASIAMAKKLGFELVDFGFDQDGKTRYFKFILERQKKHGFGVTNAKLQFTRLR